MTAPTGTWDRIAELLEAGYTVDFACEQGVTGGWVRQDVLDVVAFRGWQLDGSGRIPFRDRPRAGRGQAPVRRRIEPSPQRRRTDRPIPAVGRVPVPSLPAALEAIDQWAQGGATPAPAELERQPDAPTVVAPVHCAHAAGVCGDRAHQGLGGQADRDWFAANRQQVAANLARDGGTQTPTEGTAPEASATDAAGTAPDSSGPGHGYAGPGAQPQVSPSRSHSGKGGGHGASEAPAEPPATDGYEPGAPLFPVDQPLADWELELLHGLVLVEEEEETCRVCGCTEREPCPFGCSWAEPGLCTACVNDAPPTPAPVDVLAVGLAHPDPAVRAKANRVLRAVDQLCTALSRAATRG